VAVYENIAVQTPLDQQLRIPMYTLPYDIVVPLNDLHPGRAPAWRLPWRSSGRPQPGPPTSPLVACRVESRVPDKPAGGLLGWKISGATAKGVVMAEQSKQHEPEPRVDTRTLIILAFSATAGVLVEYYDFFIYGYAAASAFPGRILPRFDSGYGASAVLSGFWGRVPGAASGRLHLRPLRRPHPAASIRF